MKTEKFKKEKNEIMQKHILLDKELSKLANKRRCLFNEELNLDMAFYRCK